MFKAWAGSARFRHAIVLNDRTSPSSTRNNVHTTYGRTYVPGFSYWEIRAMTYSAQPSERRSALASFVRFGGVSGLGWLLDFGLLFALVRWAHLPVFVSNLLSASAAATLVFLVSRKWAFRGRDEALLLRVFFYAAYTLVIIVLASAAISYLTRITEAVSEHLHLLLPLATCAVMAKVIVTPINFLINFVVARFTSEHDPAIA